MKDRKIPINVCIPKNLLSHIEANIEGKSRSEKLRKCIELGFEILTKGEK